MIINFRGDDKISLGAPVAIRGGVVNMSNMMKVGWVLINNERLWRGLEHGRCHIFSEATQFSVINSSTLNKKSYYYSEEYLLH